MTAQTVTQAVAQRDTGPVAIMWSKRNHFRAVLPRSVDVEAFLGTAAGALYASDVPGKDFTLMKCAQANPDSLIIALMECAALGHMPGTDEYYLTPRRDHGRPKVLGIEGYKGVIERMYRSGAVAKVTVREVCAGDPFDYVEGRDRVPLHEVGGRGGTGAAFFGEDGGRDRGAMVGVYAYAELLTGAISRVVLLTRDDVFAARDSGGYKPDDQHTPWNRLDGGAARPEFKGRSMWWKTGAKRLEPWVPTSAEYRREQLRASAAASALASPPPAAAIGNGHAAPPDIVDAEIVEQDAAGPERVEPAGPAGTPEPSPGRDGGGSGNQRPAAPAASAQRATEATVSPAGPLAPGRRAFAGKAKLGDLGNALDHLVFEPGDDRGAVVAEILTALAGRDVPRPDALYRDEAERITKLIDAALGRAKGDRDEATAEVWRQVRLARNGQDASAEAGDDAG